MERISFSVAKQDHKAWVGKVRDFLDDKEDIQSSELSSHHTCRMGKWFYGEGKDNYGHLEEIIEFEIKHIKLHKLASEIYDLKKANDLKMAEEYFRDLVATSASIVNLLTSAEDVLNEGLAEEQEILDNHDLAVAWDKTLKLIVETDVKGSILFVNDNFASVCGFNDVDLIGKSFGFNYSDDMPKLVTNLLYDAVKAQSVRSTFLKFTAKSGKYFWVLANYKINKKADNTTDSVTYTLTGLNKILLDNHIDPLYNKLKQIENSFDVVASNKYLTGFLNERNRDYDGYVLNLLMTGQDSVKTNKKWYSGIIKAFNL